MPDQPGVEKTQDPLKQNQSREASERHSVPVPARPTQLSQQPSAVSEDVPGVIEHLNKERKRAQKEVDSIDAAIAALGDLDSRAQPSQSNVHRAPGEAKLSRPNPPHAPAEAKASKANQQPAVVETKIAERTPPQTKAAASDHPSWPTEAKPHHSIARHIILPLVIILILAVVGFGVWRVFFFVPPTPENIVMLSGRIEGDDSAVSPKTSGRILEIHVREGDTATAGEIIAVLDDEQLRAREEQAQAELRQAEAKTRSAREQISVLEEQARQEEANVAQQEAAHDIAQFDKEAYTRLAQSGAVSERQGKQAASTADQLAAAVVGAKRRVAGAQMQISQQRADIASAMASIGQAQAKLSEARANRQDLIVKAPFAGTVVTRTAEPGEVVTAGTPIITLLDLSKVYLRGFVPEGQIGKVKAGQAAHVYLDSNHKQPVDAYVSRIDPQATFTPENTYFREDRVKQVVGVKLQLRSALGFAKPGMPADGEILVEGNVWPKENRK